MCELIALTIEAMAVAGYGHADGGIRAHLRKQYTGSYFIDGGPEDREIHGRPQRRR
jgi:hypothetical protein